MTTSGSTNFTMNRNQIITASLRKLRIIDAAGTASAADITTGAEALNLMIKAWQVDDLTLWCLQEAVLHLEKDGQSYSLGPTGDAYCAASDAVKTQLSAAAAASATALTVDSNAGISAGDYIGVELDDGTLHWDVQNGAPGGTTGLTLTAGLASAAAADSYVFAYTTKISRPLDVLEARLRDVDNVDRPIETEVSNTQYFQKDTDKTSTGDCYRMLVVPHITNATAYTWPACDDVTKRIFMTVKRVIEDFDASSDNADMPVEALEALIYNLAVRLGPEYSKAIPQPVTDMAIYSYMQLKAKFQTRDPVQLRPPKAMRWRR